MIESGLFDFLSRSANVTAICGRRLYPIKAPQNAALPFVLYIRRETDYIVVQSGILTLTKAQIDVSCYAALYGTVKKLVDAIKKADGGFAGKSLTGYQGKMGTHDVRGVFIAGESDDFIQPQHADDVGVYVVNLILTIWFEV